MTHIPAPTAICGYCTRAYTASSCGCHKSASVQEARTAECAARTAAQRQGVADPRANHAPPTSRGQFRQGGRA